MWGFEHAGIVPDVVCLAKAIANGLPLSAIVTRRELQERWGVARTARRSAATRSRARPASRSSRRSATRASSRTPRRAGAELMAGLKAIMAEEPGSATSAAPG